MPRLEALDRRLQAACRDGTATAAACVVRAAGAVVHRSLHGATRLVPQSSGSAPEAVTAETRFDVASLTKPMATTAMALILHGRGQLELDAPIAPLLPGFVAAEAGLTPRDLLAHRSGLPAWRPWWASAAADPVCAPLFAPPAARPEDAAERFVAARARVFAALAQEHRERQPRVAAVYSDAGFILLGLYLERLSGVGLADFFAAEVARPLGLTRTRFLDARRGEAAWWPVVATRAATSRGGAVLQGEVDDDNAFALGGVAGHAGLFSTADDVAAFGEAILRAHAGAPGGPFTPESVRTFLTRDRETPGSRRALGFDTPSGERSTAGRLSREESYGHLGFTGCSLWIDLSREVVVALLTNRVHLSEDPDRIRALRIEVHDLVADAFPT